jgi:hypothetical protein
LPPPPALDKRSGGGRESSSNQPHELLASEDATRNRLICGRPEADSLPPPCSSLDRVASPKKQKERGFSQPNSTYMACLLLVYLQAPQPPRLAGHRSYEGVALLWSGLCRSTDARTRFLRGVGRSNPPSPIPRSRPKPLPRRSSQVSISLVFSYNHYCTVL